MKTLAKLIFMLITAFTFTSCFMSNHLPQSIQTTSTPTPSIIFLSTTDAGYIDLGIWEITSILPTATAPSQH